MIAGAAAAQFAGESVNYDCIVTRIINVEISTTNIIVSSNDSPFIEMLSVIVNGDELQLENESAIFNTVLDKDSSVSYCPKDFENYDELLINPLIFLPLDMVTNSVNVATLNTRTFVEPYMGSSFLRKNYRFNRNRFNLARYG